MIARPRPLAVFVILAALLAAALAARAAIGVRSGLRVEYFPLEQPTGQPAISLVTREVSTSQILQDWGGSLPPVFSARWFGYITVARHGLYTFATASDDGSTVSIDGRRVVDNGGVHGTATQRGQIELAPGSHFVLIEYFQAGGFYEMAWLWSDGDSALVPVPPWRLSPGRVEYRSLLLARALDWAAVAFGASIVVLAASFGFKHGHVPAATALTRQPRAASLALFTALAVMHTWPLASNPAVLSRSDNSDTILNEWIMAWVAHQAPRDPLDLFNANIFHPNTDTLAYSEPLIVQSALGAPVLWLGGSPVLAYNLVLIAGFALTGWTTCLVVGRWTGMFSAGLLAGILAGVNAHTLTRIPHIQAQHAEFLPLALFALDRLLRDPSVKHALTLAGWFALQASTSIYLLVFTAFAMVASAVARPEAWWARRGRRVALAAAMAGGVAALVLLPLLLPYWRVQNEQGLTRSLEEAALYSATWTDYLTTPGRYHRALWNRHFVGGTPLFPGVVGLGLALVAIASGTALADPRARMCLAVGVCGLALSFGTRLPGYATLYELLPLLQAIRAPVRIGYLVIVSVAVLAGFGLVELRRRVPPRVWPPLLVVLAAVATIEPMAAPLSFSRVSGVPAIYDRLRDEPHAVVVELPLPEPRAVFHNARFLMHSTRHWKPMLNGYSGFMPDSYRRDYEALRSFPDATSVAALEERGVTHVFLHLSQHAPTIEQDLMRIPGFRKIAQEGAIALYQLARK